MQPLDGVFLSKIEPDRECWHEAGHAVTGYHLGIPVQAIGYQWPSGEHVEPNPCSWCDTAGADKEKLAIQLFGGMAAETLKLQDHDYLAKGLDMKMFKELECELSWEHYLEQAMNILTEHDAALRRVQNALMERRASPPTERFKDTDDVWRQIHL